MNFSSAHADWRIPYPPEFLRTKLPHDILTAVALVLHRAGHSNIAAPIACRHLDKSTLLGTPEIFFAVLQAIAKGQHLADGLRLADALLQPERLVLAQVFMVPALMSSGRSTMETARQYSNLLYTPDYFVELLFWVEDKRFPVHFTLACGAFNTTTPPPHGSSTSKGKSCWMKSSIRADNAGRPGRSGAGRIKSRKLRNRLTSDILI